MTKKKPYLFLTLVLSAFLLFSFSCSQLQVVFQNVLQDGELSESPNIADADASTVELNHDFEQMVQRVQRMQRRRIQNMSDSDIQSLGNPVSVIRKNSIQFDNETNTIVSQYLEERPNNYGAVSDNDFQEWRSRLHQAITPVIAEYRKQSEEPTTETIKQILLGLNQSTSSEETCSELFNREDNHVFLVPGDNLNTANTVCPAGTVFIITDGIYSGQMIEESKNGNSWIGIGNAILDGQSDTQRAFSHGLNGNVIRNISIRNYSDHGIYGINSQDVVLMDVSFMSISPNKSGQEHGGIMFSNSENIRVIHSSFENVASSVRFRDSKGPLVVEGNTAINSGRNFLQCDKCNGSNIRINRNSMDHQEQYGQPALEDWINIYQSNGTEQDPIQVNHNRARGHSNSRSGSFILLGDSGGMHQQAIGNIGVSPGQVGIGVASGQHISVERNIMYSDSWNGSNVAFYSADYYSTPCNNHQYISSTNVANWRNADGTPNRAWTDGKCGLTNGQIRSLVREDRSIGPDIWNDW